MKELPTQKPPRIQRQPPEPKRRFQGIPGIEWVGGQELYAAWYGGGEDEGVENYVLVSRSTDGGDSWEAPHLFVDPEGAVRAFDPVVWRDPRGRLWLFWAQSEGLWDGRGGVWGMVKGGSEGVEGGWSEPRRLCDGVMMNKPTVAGDGTWLLPVALWVHGPDLDQVEHPRLSSLVISRDEGESFEWAGGADMPERWFDEHHIFELKDRRLTLFARSRGATATRSYSSDGGKTWTPGEFTDIPSPDSRFYIGVLRSGRWLLVSHAPVTDPEKLEVWGGRHHLTAWLSEDEGVSWQGGLLLDERFPVSYPDAAQAEDGTIWAIYDYNRKADRQILAARFTEDDVLAGECRSDGAKLKILVRGPS